MSAAPRYSDQIPADNALEWSDTTAQQATDILETNDDRSYMEVHNVRISPKKLVFTDPFEGKVFKATISIRNCGQRPLLIRVLTASSSGIKIKTIQKGVFLCAGMEITRTVTYKVQMMTLIKSCYIPIYINDDYLVDYPIQILTTPVVLQFKPDTLLDFGEVDASSTPTKRTLRIVNPDMKPAHFFIDLGPNDLELAVEPLRGIVLGGQEIEVTVTATFQEEKEYVTEFWVISTFPTYIRIRAIVRVPAILPQFVPQTSSFTFIQFPTTYYGTTAARNVIMNNKGVTQSFFAVLGEIEMETFTLKQVREEVPDYRYFKISPEEGRLLPNDVRVFHLTYSPYQKKNVPKQSYHLVMMQMKRLQVKDLNPDEYSGSVFDEPHQKLSFALSEMARDSRTSAMSQQRASDSELELKESQSSDGTNTSSLEVRLMLYGQVEEVAVSIIPDEIVLRNLDVYQTITRVLLIQNNCPTLPIIFRYQKIAFVEIEPKMGHLQPLESLEVQVLITPKSFDRINTNIVIEFLYYNEPRVDQELVVVGECKIAFSMEEKITTKKKSPDLLLAKNFVFKKPNQQPNDAIMNILMRSNIYIGLPDDRPHSNLPDPFRKSFRSIYAAIPRYQPKFNEYALTPRDKELLKAKNYYNMYINMAAKKKRPQSGSIVLLNDKCHLNPPKPRYEKMSDSIVTKEFIPLTPIQLVSIDIEPRNVVVENVAFQSTYIHTLKITNRSNSFLKIYLKGRKTEFLFFNGKRHNLSPNTEKDLTFMIFINALPIHSYELDVIINNCFVVATTVLVKACPKHLTLSVDMLTFYENEPPSKFVELHNELNVDIPFQWKVPSVFQVDPVQGEVVSGRFVACMITFEVGLAENMVYDLGVHTDNKFYNLKVLIEGTNYKVKIPKVLSFEEISLNVPTYKTIPVSNCSNQRIFFEVQEEHLPDGFKVKPKEGYITAWSSVHLVACANRSQLGDFSAKIEIVILNNKKITCDATGTVVFPELQFMPETLRFRKMAASSFDIACVTVVNTSNVKAMIQFDTDRFPEFSYAEYTNTEYMTDRDVLFINPKEEKQFSIHFYPYNPIVTSFPLPLVINKMNTANKSKTFLMNKQSVKVHAQVLSYKLEVKSWRYSFTYFPHYNYKNVTSHYIRIKNPCKSLITFCIRLDELAEPFAFQYVEGVKTINYECSIVVDLQPDEYVMFEATFLPQTPGEHCIKLPVYIRDDFSQDMHNYFYFVGSYPQATYKYSEDSVHLGFIPLSFTISKRIIVDMTYHNPDCDCTASMNDLHSFVEIDSVKPNNIAFYKMVSIIFNSSRTHLLNSKLELSCSCPGPNFEIAVYGGSENNYFSSHACIEYFKSSSAMSMSAIFETAEESLNVSTITIQDPDKEEAFKHNYKTNLPYFPSGTDPFDEYMNTIVAIFEKWLTEQVFYGVKAYTIPDTICLPDIKLYEKQGRREGMIKVPLQHIMHFLLGPAVMATYEIKYSEKKPIWMGIRKFYREFLNHLLSIGCFVNMIKPESLLPYDMYREYMVSKESSARIITPKSFYLVAKQCWLDLLMQSYKVLISRRMLQYMMSSSNSLKTLTKSASSRDMMISRHCGINIASGTIFSEESVRLLVWVNKHFQDHKTKFASVFYGNEMSEAFRMKRIDNFDDDICDSLGIISCLLTHCPFLEMYIMGIYAPATNRMERFNNAYILIKLLSLLQVSFKLQPNDIIEPNTIQMIMFLTYLYDFLLPMKSKDTITFSAELSQTKEEQITIMNENKHKLYYKIIFFDNADDLFVVEESQITIDPGNTFKLGITYNARFLRVQKTVILLSGEITGYQYTNSKIYFLEGRPDVTKISLPPVQLKSTMYKITEVSFDIQSPYQQLCTYEIFLANGESTDVTCILESLIPYAQVLDTKALLRCKLNSAYAEADEHGKITMTAVMCSIVKTSNAQWLLFRDQTTGDFMVKINIITKPIKKFNVLQLSMQKALSKFPCTCPKRRPDVTNSKCPRNVKVMIPCRNEYLWNSVMQFFLAGRDPEEAEFWDIYGNTPVGSHIVERILYDHKRFLTDDMAYFMNKTFTYKVRTKTPDSVVTQKEKIIKEVSNVNTTTEVLVHFNEVVKSFYLILDSVDEKETRTYKVRVNYE